MTSPLEPFRVDFSNFYKFVSSVGLVLVAAAAAVPWFVMKAAVPEADPQSPSGLIVERAVETRAQQYLFALESYPWVSGGLLALGLVLTGYGLIAWRRRQRKQDEDEDEAFRQRKELGRTTKASAEERTHKLDSEADNPTLAEGDSATEAADVDQAPQSSTDEAEVSESPPTRPGAQSEEARRAAANVRRDRIRQKIASAETHVEHLLKRGFSETHEIESGVKVPTDNGQPAPILDFVARARDPKRWTSFAVEVHLNGMQQPAFARETATRQLLGTAIAASGVPEGPVQRGGRGRPMLARSVSFSVVVLPDDVDPTEVRRDFQGRARSTSLNRFVERCVQVNSVLSRKVGVLILAERTLFSTSPRELRGIIVGLMETPDEPHLDASLGEEAVS